MENKENLENISRTSEDKELEEKLKEIDEKFGMLKKNSRILDLGASPGSWTVFALRTLEGTGHVTSIDLNPLAKDVKGDNLTFI